GRRTGVRHVERLDAVDSERAEAVDRVEHLAVVGDVPEGVSPDRDAAGVVDRLDGLGDGRRLTQAERGAPLDEVTANERADVVDVLGLQPRGIRGGSEDGLREMRAPDRFAGGKPIVELLFVELEAELAQARG